MTKNDLVKRYEFLRPPAGGPKEPLTPHLMFGIECDDGWVPILDELFSRIEVIVRREGLKDFTVEQVKEKFGSLRVYVDGANEEIRALIDEACARSVETCERCGRPGRMREIGGWFVTLCEPEYAEEKARRGVDDDQ